MSAWEYDAGGHNVDLRRDGPLVHVDGGSGLPIHGVLGASPLWQVVDTRADRLAAELDFGGHPELLETFPFPHRIELEVALGGERLSLRLSVVPTGSEAVPVSFGFHPYLRCDRRDAEIKLPVRRRLLLDGRGLPTGEHEQLDPGALDGPLLERTFDDCFDGLAAEPVFSVSDARRTISIEFMRGYRVAQVYAPEGSDFICFEPMTAPVDALRSGDRLRWVQPGSAFAAEFGLHVGSHSG